MNVNNVFLSKVGVKYSQFPNGEESKPEFAFVGKSNVGKSSLINAMVNRKKLARTSQNPGKTRTINFYDVEGKLYFVDLPGYGYAKLSKDESEKWGSMIESYLKKREELKAIIMLIDIRHSVGNNDKKMIEWLNFYGHDMIIVGTKADKLSRNELFKNTQIIRKDLGLKAENLFIPFSSETKQGKEELWKTIESYLETPKES